MELIKASRNLEEVKKLLANGADIHDFDDYAIKWASLNGNIEFVKILVEHGADIHANHDEALRDAS